MSDAEPAVLLETDGRIRAYPVRTLIGHEIVNDRIADPPLVVTHPLQLGRQLPPDGSGPGGDLRHLRTAACLGLGHVMTMGDEAVAGPLAGLRLERVPQLDTFWFAWAAHHPRTLIRADR